MRGRVERIRNALDAAQSTGAVRSWYCYRPGDRGRVWVIETRGYGTRSYATREADAFILGIAAQRGH